MTATKGTEMITVKLPYRVWEECAVRYTADDDRFSVECWGFMHAAIDANPPTNRTRNIEVTQQQINAVCDEFLRSVVELQFGESCNDRVEQQQRDRHGNAVLTFITTYYKKGN